MEMHVELKVHANDDPFKDAPGVFENQSEAGTSTRGQMSLYAAAQLSRQHRLWIFSVGIFGKFARLFRWDRAGVVVSGRIDYQANPEVLAEYFGVSAIFHQSNEDTILLSKVLRARRRNFSSMLSTQSTNA